MNKRLQNILLYAVNNTDYYKEILNKKNTCSYENFDVLTKEELRNHKFDLLANKYKNNKFGMLEVTRTSGSLGKITEVYWTKEDLIKSNLSLWRLRHKWYGVNSNDKFVSFARQYYIGTRIKKPPKIRLIRNNLIFSKFMLQESDILEYLKEMEKFKPKWIIVQPSILYMIMCVMKKHNKSLDQSIIYIELNGEYVSKSLENEFKKFFNINIANMYGAYEVNSIALECPQGNMHVMEDNVYLDCDCKKEKTFITSLTNYTMPIIKYDLADSLNIKYEECKCGMNGLCIDIFSGRTVDYLEFEDNKYSPYFILFSIESVNLLLDNVIGYFKIIQKKDRKKIKIFLKIDESYTNWKNTIKEELLINLNKNSPLPLLEFDVCFINDNLELSRNKFKFFEREIIDYEE